MTHEVMTLGSNRNAFIKLKHKDMHFMHATLNFSRNSKNSDMTKIEHFCAPAPPRDHCEFFLITRRALEI